MPDGDYARAGVDQRGAGRAVAALVGALRAIDPGRPSRTVLAPGHYAAVLALDGRTGLALACDGVGTKVIVAEQLRRFDTVGIDCIAMNVNDVVCVGAEPLAVLDYLAVERADPETLAELGDGLRRGAEEAAGGVSPQGPAPAPPRPHRPLGAAARAGRAQRRRGAARADGDLRCGGARA